MKIKLFGYKLDYLFVNFGSEKSVFDVNRCRKSGPQLTTAECCAVPLGMFVTPLNTVGMKI